MSLEYVFSCVCIRVGYVYVLEGLVLAMSVLEGVVFVLLWVVEVVGLMTVVAVTDDWMLDAFALQLILLENSLQLFHQLSDEGLRSSTVPRAGEKQ